MRLSRSTLATALVMTLALLAFIVAPPPSAQAQAADHSFTQMESPPDIAASGSVVVVSDPAAYAVAESSTVRATDTRAPQPEVTLKCPLANRAADIRFSSAATFPLIE